MTNSIRPLVVTADGPLLDELLGVAGAAGVAVDVAVDLGAARPQWTEAPIVLVGGDAAAGLRDARLARRGGVLLVHSGQRPALSPPAEDALKGVLGLPADEDALLAHLAAAAGPGGSATTIAVLPGRGGAGASTLAAGLALAAAGRGDPAWLLDLDPLGGGIDAVLGAELDAGARWSRLGGTVGRIDTQALRDAVPRVLGAWIVSCDGEDGDGPDGEAVRSVLTAAAGGGGTVVLDVPRHRTPGRDQALATVDRVVVVVPAEVRAVLAARRLLSTLGQIPPRTELVVRPIRGGLPAEEMSRALDLPLAGVMPEEPLVRAAGMVGSAEDLLGGELRRLSESSSAMRSGSRGGRHEHRGARPGPTAAGRRRPASRPAGARRAGQGGSRAHR